MKLTHQQCAEMYGQGISGGTLLLYVGIAALIAAILKILCSKRGRVNFGGINIQWGN